MREIVEEQFNMGQGAELNNMFEAQLNLQRALKNDLTTQEYKTINILSAIDELTEVLRCTPWKPWKKNQSLNLENFKEEIIDLQHFVINLALSADMDAKEFHDLFMKKNFINQGRIKNGY